MAPPNSNTRIGSRELSHDEAVVRPRHLGILDMIPGNDLIAHLIFDGPLASFFGLSQYVVLFLRVNIVPHSDSSIFFS